MGDGGLRFRRGFAGGAGRTRRGRYHQRPTQFGHLGDERRASYAYSHSNMPCGHRRDERRVTGDAQLTAAVEVDEQQTHAGIADDIAERVEEVVAGDIVEDHGVVVGPTDKARRATPQ